MTKNKNKTNKTKAKATAKPVTTAKTKKPVAKDKRHYTPEDMRRLAQVYIGSTKCAMLMQAADTEERMAKVLEVCANKRGEFAMNYGRLDYEFDTAMVDLIDEIMSAAKGTDDFKLCEMCGKERARYKMVGDKSNLCVCDDCRKAFFHNVKAKEIVAK